MNPLFNPYRHAESHFFSLISASQFNINGLTGYHSGINKAGLNPVFVNQVDPSFLKHIQNCRTFYSEKQNPWALVLPDFCYNAQVQHLLDQCNLSYVEQGVAMFVAINDINTASKRTMEIREVQGDLTQWGIPLIGGFESTAQDQLPYNKIHESASKNNNGIYHLTGFINEIPVCSLTLTLNENNARIDDLATLPSHQKRGYATELLLAAIEQAQKLNASYCFLEASESGLSVYQKVGFKELFKNRYYEPSR